MITRHTKTLIVNWREMSTLLTPRRTDRLNGLSSLDAVSTTRPVLRRRYLVSIKRGSSTGPLEGSGVSRFLLSEYTRDNIGNFVFLSEYIECKSHCLLGLVFPFFFSVS